jgi:hypothetical protein
MKLKANAFEFVSHRWDESTGKAEFRYNVGTDDTSYPFTERLSLPVHRGAQAVPQSLIKVCLDALHIVLGISYWKAFCPPSIVLHNQTLSGEQAAFWDAVYLNGLGEFFYTNSIDFHNLIRFPADNAFQPQKPVSVVSKGGLLGLGGGKDSIVAAEMLKHISYPFNTFVVETQSEYPLVKKVAEVIGSETFYVQRTIDPLLLQLNATGTVYNGHIPISAIYAFIGYFLAVLQGYAYVIVPNEHSANIGNVEYRGMNINHQWSKSHEFEMLARDYMARFLSPDISYVSVLRPLTELKIMSYMSGLPKYFHVFSSCNNNFKVLASHKSTASLWCGHCPKCAFVFSGLAAHMPMNDVIDIFHKNMFADEALIPLYRDLLGIGTMKPFECVGTFEENQAAFCMIMKKHEGLDTPVMRMFVKESLPRIAHPDKLIKQQLATDTSVQIPDAFADIVTLYENTRIKE